MARAPTPRCPEGGVVARVAYVSLDPYVGSRLRGRHMGESPPAPMSEPIPGAIVARVAQSRAAGLEEGDWIYSMAGGWAESVALDSAACRRIDIAIAPPAAYLGALGMPGLTAWAGTTQLAAVGPGDIFLVDSAAGAVGGAAGQFARARGAARVVGIAGGARKCALVEQSYGFDACVDYKRADWREALQRALPDGLTAFFENVSADMATIALLHARPYARGVLCGLAAAYHDATPSAHPINAGLIITKRARVMGLVVYDFFARWDEFLAEAGPLARDGRLTIAEDIAAGLENAPALFERLMNGENIGKCLVRVGDAL